MPPPLRAVEPSALLHFNDLWPLLERSLAPLPSESLPVKAALGRTLARPALAAWDLPRFDNSAMDGFAVRYADVATANAAAPIRLRVVGAAFAGHANAARVKKGQAIRIATGGLLPSGADTVIAREDVAPAGADDIDVVATIRPRQHVRRQGEEVNAGAILLPAATTLNAYGLAALEAAGVSNVDVYGQPRVAILVSGDELAPPGAPLEPGQIVETNGAMLARSLRRLLPLAVEQKRLVADDFSMTKQALNDAFAAADVVITTGGVSVGERDYIKDAAEALGAERLVWGVAMKPGKPLYLAKLGGKWLLGLPGNPASAGVALPVVILPLLSGLMGRFALPRMLSVIVEQPLKPAGKRTDLKWARLVRNGERLLAQPLSKSGSHMLSDLALADALIVVPPGDQPLPANSRYDAILLPQ